MISRLLHSLNIVDTRIIEEFDQQAIRDGIQKASQNLLRSLDVTVKINGRLPVLKGPILIIANHKGGLDSHSLLSIIEREDFSFVALSTYHIFGSMLRERLLPIYRKKSWNRRLFEYPLNVRLDTQVQSMTMSEISEKNRETIAEAARRVSQGWVVSIFPEGSVGKNIKGSWKAGVGYLLKQIKNNQTQIIFVSIAGHGKSDLFRFIRPDWRKTIFSPKTLTVTFSQPKRLDQLRLEKYSGKEIAAKLEEMYKYTL